MAQFQLLRCSVALDGDTDQVVVRHRGSPILLPELMVLQFLHGETAITDVHVVGTCDMGMDEALTRLRLIYGEEAVGKVFPGNKPRLPTSDRSIPPCTKPVYKLKPTLPDSPDPKLRPLDQFTLPPVETENVDDMKGYDTPAPYDEEADALDQELGQELFGTENRPSVEDLPQTRTSFRGQARQARQTPSSLPDVGGPQRQPGTHDHDRPKG
jgi:hypothetical protein